MTVTFSKTGPLNATIRDEEGERVGTVSVRAESYLNDIMELQEDARRYRAIGHGVGDHKKQLRDLKACVDAGRDNAAYGDYMCGYANGLIMALSIVEGTKPDFVDAPVKKEQPLRMTGTYRPGDVNYVPDSDGPTEAEPLAVHRDRFGGDEVTEYGMGDRVFRKVDAALLGDSAFRSIRIGKDLKAEHEARVAAIGEAHARERDKLVPFMDMSRNFTNAAKLVLAVFDVAVEIAESKAQTVERARAMDKLRALTGKRG